MLLYVFDALVRELAPLGGEDKSIILSFIFFVKTFLLFFMPKFEILIDQNSYFYLTKDTAPQIAPRGCAYLENRSDIIVVEDLDLSTRDKTFQR